MSKVPLCGARLTDHGGCPFRGGLGCKAHRLLYHSTLGLRAIKKRREVARLVCLHLNESVFKSFGKSQFPHKSVNLSFILVIVKNELTDLWGS